MSKITTEVKTRIYENGCESHPVVTDRTFSDSFGTGLNKITVSASASDEAVAISDTGTIKRLELRVHPDDNSKISVKYNGSSTAYNVSPLEVTTDNLSSITASNSSTSAVNLYWWAIYE